MRWSACAVRQPACVRLYHLVMTNLKTLQHVGKAARGGLRDEPYPCLSRSQLGEQLTQPQTQGERPRS